MLRDGTGRVVMELETADVSRLEEMGWSPPRIFEYKGRDGVTTIYGLMHLPSDFDSTRAYPVVEYIYPGPFIGSVGMSLSQLALAYPYPTMNTVR